MRCLLFVVQSAPARASRLWGGLRAACSVQIPVDIEAGLQAAEIDAMVAHLEFEGDQATQAKDQIAKLYDLFIKMDTTQVEINPFAVTPQGEVRRRLAACTGSRALLDVSDACIRGKGGCL